MTDSRPTEISSIRSADTPRVEKIRFLRQEVTKRLPQAYETQRKSGIPPDAPFAGRLAINEAGKELRKDIEREKETDIDPLTGLLNQRGFNNRLTEEVTRATRAEQPLSLVYLDANNLKIINDTLGHKAGTEYIQTIARVLQERKRQNTDFAARWGGDEFAVILPNTSLDGAREWWKQIEQAFKDAQVSISAGATVINPSDIKSLEEITKIVEKSKDEADKALYVAKPLSKSTRGCVMITTQDLTREALQEKAA